MTTLNKYAAGALAAHEVHGCTDVTGFGFLVHLCEMLSDGYSAEIWAEAVPYIKECEDYVEEFYLTAAGQRNRNHVGEQVAFENCRFSWKKYCLIRETFGGLLASLCEEDAKHVKQELEKQGLPCAIVGRIVEKQEKSVIVKGEKR